MSLKAIADQLKKGYEPFFLVECDFDGYFDRIASMPISVPGTSPKFFDGKLLNSINYGASFSFDNFQFNIGSVGVVRNNADRFQDQETRRRLDGGICTIYIWCEGLTWEQINPYGIIVRGEFEKVSHTKYEYQFNINELSKSDKFGLVPKVQINDDTWPLHRKAGGAGAVSGQFVPIIFGDWSYGVVLKCVDYYTDFLYVAMSGISKSVDADFTAGTKNVYDSSGIVINAGNYEARTTVDGLGNPVTLIDFTGNYASEEPMYCSIQGVTDGSGEYTGTAGTLIEHPSDIISYLIDNFSSSVSGYQDTETFKDLKTLYPSVKFCASINNQGSITEIINRILSQLNCAILPRTGGYQGIFTIDTSKGPSARLIQKHVQIGRTATFKKTSERSLCNKLILQYGYNTATGAYQKSLTRDKSNDPTCLQSYLQYGKEYEKTVQLQDIHDDATAALIATDYVALNAYRHDLLSWSVTCADGLQIRRGDIALITAEEGQSKTGAGWVEEPCVLIEKKYKKNQIDQTWWKIAI